MSTGGRDDPPRVDATTSYVVYTEQDGDTNRLFFRDLDGQRTPMLVHGEGVTQDFGFISGNGSVYVSCSPFRVTRFTESGFEPDTLVSGFDEPRGWQPQPEFDASSRFVFLPREPGYSGFDILDAERNVRHFSMETEGHVSVRAAPAGHLFDFSVDPGGDQAGSRYLASVTEQGISEVQQIPRFFVHTKFSPDGKRLFYAYRYLGGPVSYGYIEPPSEPREFYANPPDVRVAPVEFVAEPSGESVIASLGDPEDEGSMTANRLFVDSSRPPEPVSNAYWSITTVARTPGGIPHPL